MSCNLIRHPYVALERLSISGRTFSQNDLKNVRCQTVIIVSVYGFRILGNLLGKILSLLADLLVTLKFKLCEKRFIPFQSMIS